MTYTLGCSFTRWYWPTWADWLGNYLGTPVTNLANPGYTNDLIYQQLLTRHITPDDMVYIMWTGSNRHCTWYDREYVEQQDCQGFFPDTDGQLWYGDDYRGLYKTHPAHLPSFTHMIVDMFDTIFKTQLLLDRTGCEYRMMFWRNPWSDIREKFHPEYSYTWHTKKTLSEDEIKTAQEIIGMPTMGALLENIRWDKFFNPPSQTHDPSCYSGLWEFVLGNKELLLLNHDNDNHPNTLAQHDWLVNTILPSTHPSLRSQAQQLAREWQNKPIPEHDRRREIQDLIR